MDLLGQVILSFNLIIWLIVIFHLTVERALRRHPLHERRPRRRP